MKTKHFLFALALCLFAGTASAEVFKEATAKATEIFQSLRTLAYVLAGFGIIALATSAIFGKLSFKWLVMICTGLFILASAEQIATFITDKDASLGSSGGGGTPSAVDSNDSDVVNTNTIPKCSDLKDRTAAEIDDLRNQGSCE